MGGLSETSAKPGFHPEFGEGSREKPIIERSQLWELGLQSQPKPQGWQQGSDSSHCKNCSLIVLAMSSAGLFLNEGCLWYEWKEDKTNKKKKHHDTHYPALCAPAMRAPWKQGGIKWQHRCSALLRVCRAVIKRSTLCIRELLLLQRKKKHLCSF